MRIAYSLNLITSMENNTIHVVKFMSHHVIVNRHGLFCRMAIAPDINRPGQIVVTVDILLVDISFQCTEVSNSNSAISVPALGLARPI